MATNPQGSMEPPQGRKQDVEEAQQKMSLPAEPTVEERMAAGMPAGPQSPTFMSTIPSSMLFKNEPNAYKSPFRQQSDMGLLFRVLGQDSRVPELWRAIAQSMNTGR